MFCSFTFFYDSFDLVERLAGLKYDEYLNFTGHVGKTLKCWTLCGCAATVGRIGS